MKTAFATSIIIIAVVGISLVAVLTLLHLISISRSLPSEHVRSLIVVANSRTGKSIYTTPIVVILGILGVSIIILAVGIHLRYQNMVAPHLDPSDTGASSNTKIE